MVLLNTITTFTKQNNISYECINELTPAILARIQEEKGFVLDTRVGSPLVSAVDPVNTIYALLVSKNNTATVYAPTVNGYFERKSRIGLIHAINAAATTASKTLTVVKDLATPGWFAMIHGSLEEQRIKALLSNSNVTVNMIHHHELSTDLTRYPETVFCSPFIAYAIIAAGLSVKNATTATSTGYVTHHGALLLSLSPTANVGIAHLCNAPKKVTLIEQMLNNTMTILESGSAYLDKFYRCAPDAYTSFWNTTKQNADATA